MSASAPAPEGDLRQLVLPSPLYEVQSARQSQMLTGGNDLVDSVEIGFSVTGRRGAFTVELPLIGFRVFESGIDLTAEAETIDALYRL